MPISRDDGRYPDEACRTCRSIMCEVCPVYTGKHDEDEIYEEDDPYTNDPGEPIRGSFPKYHPSMRKE